MAGVNTDEEVIAYDGIVATGVYGVAVAPTDAVGALGVTWTDHGLTTSAGVTRSESVTATDRFAWQNNTKLRRVATQSSNRYSFTLVQTSQENIELAFGTDLVGGKLVSDPGREKPLLAFDLDVIDGDNVIREYVPKARVVEVGDRVAITSDTYGYPIVIESEYDETIEGHSVLFYSEYETVAVPTIDTALPASQGAGEIVRLVGTGFGSTTGITIGGNAVGLANIDVISPNELYFTLPAGSAGSAPIIVTNAGGASSAKAYTRVT